MQALGYTDGDQILNNILDLFTSSSLDKYTDDLLYAEAGQFLLFSEGVLLKQENLAEMEQRVFDVKMLFFSVF